LYFKTTNNMEEKEITPQDGIAIIQEMIGRTKNNISNKSFYFIFWGWLVFAAAMMQYISIKTNFSNGSAVWLLMPVGAVVTVIYSVRTKQKEVVRTYMDGFMRHLWTGFGLALILTLFAMGVNGVNASFFFLMILYGTFTFITGSVLRFPPLMFGGLCSLSCAILSMFLGDTEQLLCIALALLLSYIIPGHLLAFKHKQK